MTFRQDLTPAADGAAAPATTQLREGILEIPGAVKLFHGATLDGVKLAWRMVGPVSAPVVVALGGISANRRVFSVDAQSAGWWQEVVGPGRALATEGIRLLSFDYLGGSGETTGPRAAAGFPSVSTYDQAELLLRLLNHLGIKSLHTMAGASYGGMVALAFAERYPDRVSQLLVISASDRTHPMATAWRAVQRHTVRLAQSMGRADQGLLLARALAMASYRTHEEFAARFAGSPRQTPEGFVFPVEEYLLARGQEYAARTQPEAFLCLSESIDLHRVDAARVFVPATAVAVREDQLVPVADMRAMAARLPNAKLYEVSSVYGHDAFLKEAQQLQPIFSRTLPASSGANK